MTHKKGYFAVGKVVGFKTDRVRVAHGDNDGLLYWPENLIPPLPTGHPPSAAAGLPDPYEDLDRQIDAQVTAHKGYPTGTACYGAFSPNHSFEYASQKCYYCGITMTTLLEKLTSPVSPAQPMDAESGTLLTDQFLREPLAHRSIHEAWCDFARSLESRLHATEAERDRAKQRESETAKAGTEQWGEMRVAQEERDNAKADAAIFQAALAFARQRIAELEKIAFDAGCFIGTRVDQATDDLYLRLIAIRSNKATADGAPSTPA